MLYLKLPTPGVKLLTRASLSDEFKSRVPISHQWEKKFDETPDDEGVYTVTYFGKRGYYTYGTCLVLYLRRDWDGDEMICGLDVCESYTGVAVTRHYRLKEQEYA